MTGRTAPAAGFVVHPIGWVRSALTDRATAPRQGDEGAPGARLVFTADVLEGLRDLDVGADVLVLTWLHEANRDTLAVHPRGDTTRPLTGVFSTRSPDRPNPIGLHRVRVLAIEGATVLVSGIEAIDGTPIVDLKPVLGAVDER